MLGENGILIKIIIPVIQVHINHIPALIISLVPENFYPRLANVGINGIVISDHAAVSLKIQIDKIVHSPPNWRFQARWLQDQAFVDTTGSKIDNFFALNTDETSACIRWEAFKAFIRGEIISYTSYKTKHYKMEMENLENQIKILENDLFAKDDPLKQKELIILRAKYNKISTDESAKSLMWLKQGYHDQDEKPGKLLAWRIKKQQTDRAINSIRTPQGILTIDPLEINTCFKDFYESLYRSECNQDLDTQETFLDQLQF